MPQLRPFAFVAVLQLLLVQAGCTVGSAPDAQPADDRAAALARWNDAGIVDYRFDYQQECFCVPEQVQPVTIEVRDGRVTRVVSRATAQEVSGDNLRWPTVPELFETIARAQRDGIDPLVVRYDPALGYPARIEAGSLAADAGVIYQASGLQPITP